MPASEAQIASNRANSLKSCGPKSPQGKATSSGNALKHGLTAVKLLPECEAREVERRSDAFVAELNPTGDVGEALARHAARMSVRMERCGEHENALMAEHVRKSLAEFLPPEGASEAEIARLRIEIERRALIDPSKEATLARKYELAAERGFFRALKELRIHEKAMKKAEAEMENEVLASFSKGEELDREFDSILSEEARPVARSTFPEADPFDFSTLGDRVDVPITIGKRR